MRVFADANILVSVLNKEYPLFTFTARFLSLANHKGFEIYTSPICLAIAFYFASKKYGAVSAKKRISILLVHIHVAQCGKEQATATINNVQAHDFEDALQYYTAIQAKCKCIVTTDIDDYYYSKIEILGPEDFLKKYL